MSKPTDLDAVQQLCDEATPGPWVRFSDDGKDVAVMPACRPGDICEMKSDREDGAFIAFARSLVPQMVAEIRELRAELAAERARTDALVAVVESLASNGAIEPDPDRTLATDAPLRAIAHARRLAAGGEAKR